MLSETELVQIFPEGRALLITKAKRIIAECQLRLRLNLQKRQEIIGWMNETSWDQRWIYDWLLELNNQEKTQLNKEISHETWRINSLKGHVKTKNKITDEDIYQAKQIKIETLYSGQLRKVGQKLWGKCPFHPEKSGSFCVYLAQNSWWCFGCSEGGSVVDFVMKQQNLSFIEALKLLLRR